MTGTDYYKSVDTYISTAEMINNPENDRFYGADEDEKINVIGTHERWHLDPNQMYLENRKDLTKKEKEMPVIRGEKINREEYWRNKGKNPSKAPWQKNYKQYEDPNPSPGIK